MGEKFGKFGEPNTIRQYFTPPNSRFIKVAMVAIVNSPTFPHAKTLKRSIRHSFTPPQFCAIQYVY